MADRTCWNCVYVSGEPGRLLRSMWMGEPLVPRCANHPQWPGQLHDVPGVPCGASRELWPPRYCAADATGVRLRLIAARRDASFLCGSPTHRFGVTWFGAPVVYVRTGSVLLNEVVWPQSPGAEFRQVIPQIDADGTVRVIRRAASLP